MKWYPEKPTLVRLALGIVFFIALAAVPLYWSVDEADVGSRIFLWILAGLALLLATWRLGVFISLVRDRRSMQ